MSIQSDSVETPLGYRNYVESILDVFAGAPERHVITDTNGQKITAGTFRDDVYRLAAELAGRGIGRGSTVALMAGNCPEALSVRYAANLLGARVALLHEMIHKLVAPDVVARTVKSVDATLLLVDPELEQMAGEVARCEGVPAVLFLGPTRLGEDLMACAARHIALRVPSAAHAADDWCLRMTGGSTGIPNIIGVSFGLGHLALAKRAAALREQAGDDAEPRFLACASIAHSAGIQADAALLAGGRVILQRVFEPGEVLAAIERERITHVWMISPNLRQVLDHPSAGTTDVSSLRWLGYGGHSLSPTRLHRALELFGSVLHGWYGQTEAGGLIAEVLPHEHHLIGRHGQITAGRSVPGVEVAVCGPAGEPLPTGQVGEFRVRSPKVMSGYLKQPELSAEVLCDGWLRTGDAGYLDDAGYLYICGRYKEVIKLVGSHQIFPAELEDLLVTHPAVAQCMVFGVRRPDDGEEVHTAIVPASGHTVDLELVRNFVTAHKGPMSAPTALHLLDVMPLNALGKPNKREVQAALGLINESVTIY
jgi:fatty-acyl-CoA synthase